ncbi:ricin-type beta-trefoil lectin domain protein [Streptomyces sp. MC1]|uniref:RICIN domain-containing protein n=1 Tax=Streptomyces sp. MC1 TaxID=295105 RepID=UPI0018C9DF1A|nr:RICIN domain-containing protein [Streptomyces sp. MC1]MBG7700731.1 ricin-type beta-trefoil lectin domain protein [Streptomyces sp. MC1]
MAEGDHATAGDHEDAPDARLTELLRSPTSTAYPALQELRRRHHPAVLGYARLCATSDSAARRLAAETFTTAARETARGVEPPVPLRHRLLLLTVRLAADWARDERAAGVDPGLLLVLTTAGPEGPTPPLLPAFRSLPSRTQGLLWYGVLDAEPEERTAAFLGLGRADVSYDTPRALTALAQACLRHRLAASDDPRCADFRRLIEEVVRPDAPRRSADLDTHMARCPHCAAAFEELRALRDAPRQTLAEGLLPWRGTAYLREDQHPGSAAVPTTADGPGRPPRGRVLLGSAALGVALTPLLVFLFSPAHSTDRRPAAATPAPSSVTVTATVSLPPPPSHSPSPSPTSKSPSATPASHRPAPTPSRRKTPSPTPPPAPPGAAYAQVVNLATGRCLDIRDGDLAKGTDVVTAPCDSSATQRWSVDASLGVLRSAADDDFCLDSRGSVDRGVGIWECDSVYGRNGANLRFTVDPDGTIRPAIAIETAVTPDDGDGVSLRALSDGRDQRWRAGAR